MRKCDVNKQGIAIVGYGTVGQGVYQLLKEDGFRLGTVESICVKSSDKERNLPDDIFCLDIDEVLENPKVSIVIEVIDDAQAAYGVVTKAVKRGKAVISANKKLIAEHFDELMSLSQEYNAPLLYEASCCGSIPILQSLNGFYSAHPINAIYGVFNASSQSIISRMQSSGCSLGDAISEVQRLGYAESDPSLDLSGDDSRYKLSLLAVHAFGLVIPPESIPVFGIQNIGSADIAFARQHNCRIKLIGRAGIIDQGLSCRVLPEFIPDTSLLYPVESAGNAVIVESRSTFGEHLLYGKGAGGRPTASAILSDLELFAGGQANCTHRKSKQIAPDDTAVMLQVYVREDDAKWIHELASVDSVKSYPTKAFEYAIARVDIGNFLRDIEISGKQPFVAVIPDEFPTGDSND